MNNSNGLTEKKRCSHCGIEKDIVEYYSCRDGRLYPRCKACAKDISLQWKRNNRDKTRAYIRRYRENHKRVYRSGRNDEWERKNPEKHAAHRAIDNGVYAGKIIKPNSCSECGVECLVHGHHEDYSRPLDVIWLCPKCHAEKHK